MDYPTRPCELCGTNFKPVRRTSRTCSAECRKRLNNQDQYAKLVERRAIPTCQVCDVQMPSMRRDRKTCSLTCKMALQRDHYIPQNARRAKPSCETCGRSFDAVRSDARFCSARCHYDSDPRFAKQRSEYSSEWAKANKERRQAIARNYKDKRRGWESSGHVDPADWKRTVKRYANLCAYCGTRPYEHMDHVLPLSRGGSHSIGNVLPACADCNLSKHNRFLMEWKMREVMKHGGSYAR